MQLEGYVSNINENYDKNGKLYYTDSLGNVMDEKTSVITDLANKLKAAAFNANRWINETNPNSEAYQQKANILLGLETAPFGLGANATKAVATKLTPYVGRSIGQSIAEGTGGGLVGGAVEGFNRGLIEGENPFKTMATDALMYAGLGGLGGYGLGKIASTKRFNNIIDHINTPKRYWIYSSDNANDILRNAEWENGLDNYAKQTIKDYTDSGYLNINNSLRRANTPYVPSLEEKVNAMSDAISRYDLEEPMTVYRSVDSSLYSDYLDNPQSMVGEIFPDNAFLSTSVVKSDVYDPINPVRPNNSLIELSVPEGVGVGAYIDNLSNYVNQEHEFLINRGNQFKVKNAFKDGKNLYIEGDLLP